MKRVRVQTDEWDQLPLFSNEMLKEARVVPLPIGERTVNEEFVRRWGIPPSKRRVLDLLALNHSNSQIAEELHLKRGSVEQYISSMIDKTASLGIENRADLVYYATRPSPPNDKDVRVLKGA